ncbi:hypothetical protein BU25DRAFT_445527 [Macroventuria anomochaeta]|uniref:Uncharacterized protein n=1 Tax=Macroventuria anomochaeta TaxID=301207 RepID=A0ACB6SDH3_9PLEO|nr:uncharacterized protein BU25DRAFT_445527 [Macroventuria anomochaeta]KAF2631364.1 hypothetical protein BU25DRAFT_445527 [Macroventuria anomochaeta]
MQLPRRSVRSIQELPSIYTAFPAHYTPVRTHSASTTSDSARSPDIDDGLEVVPLEHDSILSAPIVSAYLDEKEVFISTQEILEKPLPSIPTSIWDRTWGRMSVKYRVLAVLGLQALVLLTVGTVLLAANSKPTEEYDAPSCYRRIRKAGGNDTNTSSTTPIERGTFQVPIQLPQQQSSTCLARANESRAWQCAFDTTLQLSILPSLGDDADKPVMITLGLPSTSNRSVHCGQQAPEIGPTALTTFNGSEDGPQYHFSATYDRTVILREDQLRQEKTYSSPMQGQPKHTTFLPGQSLWRCTFNDTLLEGFIYTKRDGGSVFNGTDAPSGHLPHKLKLVEHRLATGSAPYCEKVVVGLNGDLENGDESVDLKLSDAQSGSGTSQGDSDTSCQCQWIVE